MRDLSQLLWCDLINDEERLWFIESGRAERTGVIAVAVRDDIAAVYREVLELRKQVEPKGGAT